MKQNTPDGGAPSRARTPKLPELAKSIRVGYDRTVGEEQWLTPEPLVRALGPFGLDPCSPIQRPWNTAKRHFTKLDDGLKKRWPKKLLIWMNPPYGPQCQLWMEKAAKHGDALCLVFARTDTRWFHETVWEHPNTTAVLFLKGRLRFCRVDGTQAGTAGAPNVLVAYGERARERLQAAVARGAVNGRIILLNDGQAPVYRLGLAA